VALRRLHLLVLLLPFLLAGTATSFMSEGTVVRVVDGDTIQVQLADRVEKIRYIGVNTPEIHHSIKGREPGGRQAAQVNQGLVGGRRVLLAYVWIGDTMVNAELVRLGYAQVMTVPPNVRYQELFVKLQREARDANRGLWRSTEQAVKPS
jgi:micrococcal nuclease